MSVEINSTKQINREEDEEFREFHNLFRNLYAEHQNLPDPKPSFEEFWKNRVVPVDVKLYNRVRNALKSVRIRNNPVNVTKLTNKVISQLLSKALTDDNIVCSILIASGKSEDEAKKIIAKLRDET